MKNRDIILHYLEQKRLEGQDFVFEGLIEDYVRSSIGSKGGTVSRILRYMREDKEIISTMKEVGNRKYLAYGLPKGQLSL